MTKENNAQLPIYTPTTLGTVVVMVTQTVEDLGFDSQSVMSAAGVHGARMDMRQPRVAVDKLAKVWQKGVEVTSNDALGIEVAKRIRPGTWDALSMSLFASETLMSALAKFSRYHTMISDALVLEIETGNISVALKVENLAPIRAVEGIDAAIATPIHFCREISGEEIIPEKVCFKRPAPENIDAFSNFFRCPMEFNAQSNCIILAKQSLEHELPGSNVEISNYLEEFVSKHAADRNQSETLSRAYSFITKHLPSGKLTEELLADQFNCSTRQLQRRLKDEGTSFREFRDGIREELGKQYIRANQFSIAETSYLLGYTDPNSFSRAFRKWTGMSPKKFRNL